jgi:hypothetical protein
MPLRTIETKLTELARELQRNNAPAATALTPAQSQSLAAVEAHQAEVLAALTALLRDLADASEVQQYQRELAELKSQQSALREQTETLAREALRGDAQEPTNDQQQRRDQAVAKQRELAAELASALARMRQSAAALADAKPTDAARLDAAIAEADKQQIQNEVRAAAEHLAARRFAQAADSQRQTAAELQQLLDRLAQPGEAAAERRLAKLEDAARQLQSLRREVEALAPAMDRASLAERAKALARRLEQLRAPKAAKSTKQAGEQLAKGDASQKSNQEAQQRLAEAQQQLAAEHRQEETRLSKQQVERLDAVITRLVAAQQSVVEETLQLDSAPLPGNAIGARRAKRAEVGLQQASVRKEALAQASQIERFPVFARLMRAAADTMERAEANMTAEDATAEAAPLTTRALDELQLLADAVRHQRQQQSQAPKPSQSPPQPPGGNAEGQKNDPNQVQALQLAVAQLGLLRTMQADLKEKTAELERLHAEDKVVGPGLREELARLADEQRELAELADVLVEQATVPPPQGGVLPDLDEELQQMLGEDPEVEATE